MNHIIVNKYFWACVQLQKEYRIQTHKQTRPSLAILESTTNTSTVEMNTFIVLTLVFIVYSAKIHSIENQITVNKSVQKLNPVSRRTKISTVSRPVDDVLNFQTRRGAENGHLHEIYTVQYPESCPCQIGKGLSPGTCYRFLPGSSTQCSPGKCKPSFICAIGMATGITCIRKVITRRILSNGDGTCKMTSMRSFVYVPYSG